MLSARTNDGWFADAFPDCGDWMVADGVSARVGLDRVAHVPADACQRWNAPGPRHSGRWMLRWTGLGSRSPLALRGVVSRPQTRSAAARLTSRANIVLSGPTPDR